MVRLDLDTQEGREDLLAVLTPKWSKEYSISVLDTVRDLLKKGLETSDIVVVQDGVLVGQEDFGLVKRMQAKGHSDFKTVEIDNYIFNVHERTGVKWIHFGWGTALSNLSHEYLSKDSTDWILDEW